MQKEFESLYLYEHYNTQTHEHYV